jgi:hypothetical protein
MRRLNARGRFSRGSGCMRLEPAAGAIRLMKGAGFRAVRAVSAQKRPLARLGG